MIRNSVYLLDKTFAIVSCRILCWTYVDLFAQQRINSEHQTITSKVHALWTDPLQSCKGLFTALCLAAGDQQQKLGPGADEGWKGNPARVPSFTSLRKPRFEFLSRLYHTIFLRIIPRFGSEQSKKHQYFLIPIGLNPNWKRGRNLMNW